MDKEKQPLMVDLEQGTKLSKLNEPREMIMELTDENETGSGQVGRWSEGLRDPNLGTVQKANKVSATTKPDSYAEYEFPGLLPSSFSHEYCCIYRVPNRLRRVNPEAYTPQMLLIGPFHHSKKAQALKLAKTDLRYLDYMNMELHKKKYLTAIATEFGNHTVEELRRIIKRDEQIIRESYAESTDWINPDEFVEMILHDSVFILQFMMHLSKLFIERSEGKDILINEPLIVSIILEDLILLENQLPYALLENLFETLSFNNIETTETLRDITLRAFSLQGYVREEVKFRHFTDLFRRARVETLGLTMNKITESVAFYTETPQNADMLDCAGVHFEGGKESLHNDLSLVIKFEGRILKMPCFTASDHTEKILRNIMALEQLLYYNSPFVCNYIAFLDCLITTDQDVDLLVKKGVIKNFLESGEGSVKKMVGKMCDGLFFTDSYNHIFRQLDDHCKSRINTLRVNMSIATLRRVYFQNLWTGTATMSGVVLLVMTLIGTVASVLQVTQDPKKSH